MIRLAGFAALLMLLPVLAFAQLQVDWTQPTRGVSIAVDAAGAVFTVDYEYNPAGDITLTKRAADGTLLWAAGYDQTEPSKWERAQWVATDPQGNALVAGTLMSGYSNPVTAASLLMKFSPDGVLLWRRVYEGAFDGSSTRRCAIDESGAVYVLGLGMGPAGLVTTVKKFAADGTALWSWFDPRGIGAPLELKTTPDQALLVVCRGVTGNQNGYAKLDRDGQLLWSLAGVYSLTVGDAAGDAAGNTYVVHGASAASGGTTVRKLSPAGAPLWSHDHALAGFRVVVGGDGRPVVCGFPNTGSGGASFIKLDDDGSVVWANPDADGPLALLLHARLLVDSRDDVYLAAGTLFEMAVCRVSHDGTSASTVTMPGSYAQSIELDGAGNVYVVGGSTVKLKQAPGSIAGIPGDAIPAGAGLAQNHPNPCAGSTAIRFALPAAERVSLRVYDLAGREVATLADGELPFGEHLVRLEASALPDGVYLYRLRRGTSVETRRLVVLH